MERNWHFFTSESCRSGSKWTCESWRQKQVVQCAGFSNLCIHSRTQYQDETSTGYTKMPSNIVRVTFSFQHFWERHQQHSIGLNALCWLFNLSTFSRPCSLVAILGGKAYHATHIFNLHSKVHLKWWGKYQTAIGRILYSGFWTMICRFDTWTDYVSTCLSAKFPSKALIEYDMFFLESHRWKTNSHGLQMSMRFLCHCPLRKSSLSEPWGWRYLQ